MKQRSTQLLSLFLAFVLVVGLCPISARAADSKIAATVTDASGNVTSYDNVSAAWKAAKGGQDRTFKLFTDWDDLPDSLTLWDGLRLTIDLNGHMIRRSAHSMDSGGDGSVIFLHENAQLTINDSSEDKTGSIQGGNDKEGGGIHTEGYNTITMNAGTITDCQAKYGGGVYLEDDSKLILNGGSIYQNSATSQGGGVYAEVSSTIETHGGEICGNKSSDEGGGIYLWSSTASLSGCKVNNNQASNEGGGIYADYNVFRDYSSIDLNNTSVCYNSADKYGGIYFCGSTISLSNNARVARNTCLRGDAAGIYSKKSSIWLGYGNVQVFGNEVASAYRDIAYGTDLSQGFYVDHKLGNESMIGVYTGNGNKPTHWYYNSHLLVSDCDQSNPKTDPIADSLCNALFSNDHNTFEVTGKLDKDTSFSLGLWDHKVWVNYADYGHDYDRTATVTQVIYKNEVLPASDYSSFYDNDSHILRLNVPEYVLDLSKLVVHGGVDGGGLSFWRGADVCSKVCLQVNNVLSSPDYTIKVEGGFIDGDKNTTQTTKKYRESFTIQPDIPAGKQFFGWKVTEGDADDMTGFEAHTGSLSLEAPKHNVTFKAVFKDKISRVDFTVTPDIEGGMTGNHDTEVSIRINGQKDPIHTYTTQVGRWVDWLEYNTSYGVTLRFSDFDIASGQYALADEDELKVYVNGSLIPQQDLDYTHYSTTYGKGQRLFSLVYYRQTAKAKVTSVETPTLKVPPTIEKSDLTALLPSAVTITYQGHHDETTGQIIDQKASVPVTWSALPENFSSGCTLTGTVTIPDDLDATAVKKTTTLTVEIDNNMEKPDAPTANVDGKPINNDGKIMWGQTLTFSAKEGAAIWYQDGNGAFTLYSEGLSRLSFGQHTIKAYCIKDGYRSDLLTLTVTILYPREAPVTIVDEGGKTWKYASGGGIYDVGAQVTINGIDGDDEKTVTRWSAEGIDLTEEQKTSPMFTFTMPENPVTIHVEDYRYYVKDLYLTSLTPVVGSHLPTTLEIVRAKDSLGNEVKDPPLKVTVWQWQIGDTPIPKDEVNNYIVQADTEYTAILSVEPTSGGKRETCTNFTVYIDDDSYQLEGFFWTSSYLFSRNFTATNDTLKSVDLGSTITVYTGNTLSLPDTVGVKTKYGSITTVPVTWSGTVNTKVANDYSVNATLNLPSSVNAGSVQTSILVTVQVRDLVSNVVLEPAGGTIPTKLGEKLPTGLTVTSEEGKDAGVTVSDFAISPNGGTAAKGTEYTLTAKLTPKTNYEISPDATVTIHGILANIQPNGDGSYTVTETFTTDESKTCTVTFDANGGKPAPDEKSVEVLHDGDSTHCVLPTAEDVTGMKKDSCAFLGWTTEKHTETLAADGAKPTDLVAEIDVSENTTVYALWGVDSNKNGKWDGDENTLTISKGDYTDANINIAQFTMEIAPGADLPTVPNPTSNAVYTFKGWKCSADGRTYSTIGAYNSGTMPKQSITMTAQWEKKVKVAYVDSEGNELAATETITVPVESKTYTAQLKAFKDYNFVGALAEKTHTFDGTETEIPTITLTYQLSTKTYTVTFDANGGTNPPTAASMTVPSDSTTSYTLPDAGGMTREGYVFLGWATAKDGSAVDSIEVSTDTTVYALWGEDSNGNGKWDATEATKTLTFATGDYTKATVPEAQSILPGGSLPTITNPTGNDVYQFAGWQCGGKTYDNVSAYNKGKMPEANVTMTALWTKKVKVAYVDESGNTLRETQTITVPAAENSYTAQLATIEGYAFIGSEDSKTYTFTGEETSIQTITLKYQLPAKTCRVTFNPNGGSGTPTSEEVNVAAGTSSTSYTLPTPSLAKDKCVFLGWTTAQHNDLTADGTKPDDIVTSIDVSEDTTVYALWGVDNDSNNTWDGEDTARKLTFEKGIYTKATVPNAQDIRPSYELPNIETLTGNDVYTFAGWKCSVDGKIYASPSAYNGGKMPDRAVTMTAQWTKTIKVVYANNLQETETVTVPVDQDTYTPVAKAIPGYTFVSAAPAQHQFKGTEDTIPTITLTYNKTYTVTFNANGGTGAPETASVTVAGDSSSAEYTLPGVGNMKRDGYVFRGWTTADAPQTVITSLEVSADTTVYALWGEDANGNGKWDGSETTYTLTIANGEYSGAGVAKSDQRLPGISLADIKNPEGNDVYTFKGWKYSAGSTTYASVSDYNGGKMPDANVTLTAQWEKKLQVVYQAGTTETQTVTLPVGQKSYTAEAKNIAGYTFVSAAPARSYTFTGTETEVPTIKLTYQPAARTYKVIFDANGGSNAPAEVPVTVASGTSSTPYTLPTADTVTNMTKRDYYPDDVRYVFLGWTATKHADLTAADKKPTDIVTSVNVTAYVTVYALWGVDSNGNGKWDAEETPLTLTFATGEYTNAAVPAAQKVLTGGKLPSITNPKGNAVYTFKGWKYDDQTYSKLSDYNSGKMPSTDVTMTAQWEKTLRVAYVDGNGQAVQAMETVTVAADEHSYTAAAKEIAGYRLVSANDSETYTFTGAENAVPTITFTYRKVSSSSGGVSGGTATKTEITTNPDGSIKITPPKNAGKTKVEIPVKDVTAGTVAIIVKPDGTEEIVKDALPTENGIELTVEGEVTVKIVDNAKHFTDTKGHWAESAIDFVSARGLVNGMSETIFAPNAPTTRAQLWTILARQADADLTGGSTWYEKAQAWAKSSGISDGSDPNGNITRAQMVTMLWRAAGSPAGSSGSPAFSDVPADSYYAQAVAWAAEKGITTGVGDGKFDPNGTCTRAQIATFLYRTYVKQR